MVGKLVVNKTDSNGTPVAGATFTLNRLNEETNQYEPIMYDQVNQIYTARTDENAPPVELLTNDQGIVVFDRIAPGNYELKETNPPMGYVGQKRQVRFLVENTVNQKMLTDSAYEISTEREEVIHNFTIDAVNHPINIDFRKIEPIAMGIGTAEKMH